MNPQPPPLICCPAFFQDTLSARSLSRVFLRVSYALPTSPAATPVFHLHTCSQRHISTAEHSSTRIHPAHAMIIRCDSAFAFRAIFFEPHLSRPPPPDALIRCARSPPAAAVFNLEWTIHSAVQGPCAQTRICTQKKTHVCHFTLINGCFSKSKVRAHGLKLSCCSCRWCQVKKYKVRAKRCVGWLKYQF